MNAAALALVVTSVAAFWLQLAGFVAVSRATRSYASEQLSGDSKRARHTILPAWRPLLESLSPADFGTIVGQVNLEFDQPKVAELLAKQLRGGVTAAHIIEANRKAAENQPPSIIAKLAPLCVDLHDNVDAIEAGLNQWDKVLSKRALRPEESV